MEENDDKEIQNGRGGGGTQGKTMEDGALMGCPHSSAALVHHSTFITKLI
jgi:hypothetical protein